MPLANAQATGAGLDNGGSTFTLSSGDAIDCTGDGTFPGEGPVAFSAENGGALENNGSSYAPTQYEAKRVYQASLALEICYQFFKESGATTGSYKRFQWSSSSNKWVQTGSGSFIVSLSGN